MDDRKLAWVAIRLLREGVAPRHVRRCVEELRSHRADLLQQLCASGYDSASAQIEADVRLGAPEHFIAATLARPELRSWANRAPWLVFGVLPLVAFVALGMLMLVALVSIVEAAGQNGDLAADSPLWRFGGVAVIVAVQWGLPLAISGFLLAIARRGRTAVVWPAVGMTLIAVIAALVTLGFSGPPAGGGKGELSAGIGFPPRDVVRTAVLLVAAFASVAWIWLRRRVEDRFA